MWELGIVGLLSSGKTSAFCFYLLTGLSALFHFDVILQNLQASMNFSIWFSFIEVKSHAFALNIFNSAQQLGREIKL